MSVPERKLLAEAAVRACNEKERAAGAMISCSDQNMDTVLELGHHAAAIGADYVVVGRPIVDDADPVGAARTIMAELAA